MEGLASVLEADLTTYKAKILKILSECALKLPDKCTIYTTLIGLLNTKNYNFGGEVGSFMNVKYCKRKVLYIFTDIIYIFLVRRASDSFTKGLLKKFKMGRSSLSSSFCFRPSKLPCNFCRVTPTVAR